MKTTLSTYRKIRILSSAILIFIGVFGILMGYAYLALPIPPSARGPLLLDAWWPIKAWAVVWIVGGVGSTVAGLWAKPWGAAIVVGMLFVWSFAWCASWLIGGPIDPATGQPVTQRDWLNCLVYLVPGLLLLSSTWLASVAVVLASRTRSASEVD